MLSCKNCVMTEEVKEFKLDINGVCNFCHQAQKSLKEIEAEKPNFFKHIRQIEKDGRGKKYNCLIGLSGGVDSSTALHYAVKLGLKPLCFTMDNGYNDPRADENVLKLVETLKVPLYRYVLDLKKYKELQLAYIQAGVINVEASYDHLLMAATYEMADKYGIKWIISGGNVATESIMPESWSYSARDLTNLKDIYKRMTGKDLEGLPVCGLWKWNYYKWIKGINIFYLLDYFNYDRKKSEQMLTEEYGFQSTGEKHEENTFTRWYQNYYLPTKFGIDKRMAHYSSLINSGQMTRDEAIMKMTEPLMFKPLEFNIKRSHYDFKTDEKLWKFMGSIVKTLRGPWMK